MEMTGERSAEGPTLDEVTAELENTKRELESLAYAISHDLRAPLRTVFGFGNLLIRKYGDQLQGQPREYLDRIISGIGRMEAMIEGLLKLSRTGRAEMEREQVDVSAVAHLVVADLQRGEPERRVDVDVEPGIVCMGDPSLLRTVIQNLLHNAWKFTGGSPSPHIRVFSRTVDHTTHYCVADNGAGFTMNQADRLFNPFQRLHLETEFPGIGIGLAVVKKIIVRHGGDVFAEGEEGNGATFCFTLGRDPATPRAE